MERALVGGPVGEEHRRDGLLAADGRSQGRPDADGDARPDDAVGPGDARLARGHVHRAGTALAGAVGAAVDLGHERLQADARG